MHVALGGVTRDYDTLDDLPKQVLISAESLSMIVFHPWYTSMVGVVIRGAISMQFSAGGYWGMSVLRLSTNEGLQMRIHPKGVIGNPSPNCVVVISTRIFNAKGEASVATAFLFPMPRNTVAPDLNGDKQSERSMGCGCCHLLLPSLFNQHDAAASEKNPMGMRRWIVMDNNSYHAIRPSTFTVVRYECDKWEKADSPNDAGMCSKTSYTPGMSQYVIAGALVGADVEETTRRSHETVKYTDWHAQNSNAIDTIRQRVGMEESTDALNCAVLLLDLLSADGILGMLSDAHCDGALPDAMHAPHGIPLLIAASMRIAQNPILFKDLSAGSEADMAAANQLKAAFESQWQPIIDNGKGNRSWAIDIALREGMDTARVALKEQSMRVTVVDNLIMMQRLAYRCLMATFGMVDEVDNPRRAVDSVYGTSNLVREPLDETRRKVMARKSMMDNNNSSNVMSMCSREEKRITLVRLMNTVEEYLRSGRYDGLQIVHPNESSCEAREVVEKKRNKKKAAFKKGGESAFREENARGRHDVEAVATALAESLDLFVEEENVSLGGNEVLNDQSKVENVVSKEMCVEAMSHASSAITAYMCQGPMVHHQMDIECYLVSEYATNKCADCEETLHVITSTLMQLANDKCTNCSRRRCFRCRETAIQRAAVNSGRKPQTCLRCNVFFKPS